MNVGDIFVSIRGDGAKLPDDAKKAAETAGDTAGRSFSDRFGKAARVGFTAITAGAGAVLGGLSTLALQGENAMAHFRAETGATQEEAEAAFDAMNRLASDNLQSFDQVAATLTTVRTQMGLTGDEAEAMAGRILKWSTATGQDAVEATKAFDDVLDAWNLTAADSQAIMDALLVSHQKYGGTIAGSQDALTKLAPALSAANMGWEDAVGLINLANQAGVEAADVVPAMQRALTKVHSPEELKTLLADIGSTENAFERSAKAADLFGARGGAKLGRALGQSHGDLAQFKVDVGEAAGATDEAASAIEDTLPNKVKLAVANALAAVRDLGTDLGPALTGSAALVSLGSSFASALGLDKAIGKVVGPAFTAAAANPVVQAVVKLAGQSLGGLLVIGVAVGLAALLVDAWAKAINDAREKIINDPGSVDIVEGVQGRAPAWAAARLHAGAEAQKVGEAALKGFNEGYSAAALSGKSPFESIAEGLRAIGPEGARIAEEMGGEVWKAFQDGVVLGPPLPPELLTGRLFGGPARGTFNDTATREAAAGLVDGLWQSVGDAIRAKTAGANTYISPLEIFRSFLPVRAAETAGEEAAAHLVSGFSGYDFVAGAVGHAKMLAGFHALGARIPGEIAAGGQERETDLLVFLSDLRDLLKNGLTPVQTAMRLVGSRAVDSFSAGLRSKIAGAKDKALDLFVATVTAVSDANLHGARGHKAWRTVGQEVDKLYASGMNEEKVRAVLAGAGLSQAAIDSAIAAANDPETGAKPAGSKHGHKHADGIRGTKDANRGAGKTISQAGVDGSHQVNWDQAGQDAGTDFANGVKYTAAQLLSNWFDNPDNWMTLFPTGNGNGNGSNNRPRTPQVPSNRPFAPSLSSLERPGGVTVRHEFGPLVVSTPNLSAEAAGAFGRELGSALGLDTIVSGFDRVLTSNG